jgi:uncharacterized repeat protein (TIGR03803 family)
LAADAEGKFYGVAFLGGTVGVGGVYKLAQNSDGTWKQTMIHSFTFAEGGNPQGALVFDKAGSLYGVTGGGYGPIFKLTPQANGQWTESTVWAFGSKGDGSYPASGMVFDAAGNLYGATNEGGANGCGTVFRLTPAANGSWNEKIIYSFGCATNPSNPSGGLIFDGSGNLYGVTANGGAAEYGAVYELVSGSGGAWTEQTLYEFPGGANGHTPVGALTFDKGGNLYGAADGGSSTACFGPCGVIFELAKDAGGQWSQSVVHNFSETDGNGPLGSLTIDANGNLYGTTISGGASPNGAGTVFELAQGTAGQWTERLLWSFTEGLDGAIPRGGAILGSEGKVYATSSMNGGLNGNGTVIELTPTKGGPYKEKTLTNLPDGNGGPTAGVTPDGAGNFFGTTSVDGQYGFGTVYEITPKSAGGWKVNILYNFPTGHVFGGTAFGAAPSGLIFDASGNLYGETGYGGASGNGMIFELSPGANGSWVEKDIYDFAGGTDGSMPLGGLIFDAAGNLYGTTEYGGSSTACHGKGCGTVFKLTRSGSGWSETVLYTFVGGTTDGSGPAAGVVFDKAGNLYGTTLSGGAGGGNCGLNCGSMFEISPSGSGWKETFVHLFSGQRGDPSDPSSRIVIDGSGNLYGTSFTGGTHTFDCSGGCGTVFEFSPNAGGGFTETVVYAFSTGSLANGLVMDSAGNLYGTAVGTVFELSPAAGGWTETTLYTFGGNGSGDGSDPLGALILDGAGNLFGTTANGGASSGGTVYEIIR